MLSRINLVTMASNKLSRDEWIKAATQVLATSGIDQVRVDRLARKLKITRAVFIIISTVAWICWSES